MCTALVTGNVIGSGVFLLPASLAPFGSISLLAWALTAGGAVLLALLFARLARRVPGAGGPYAYTREAFGEFAGFLVGWGYALSLWTGNAAIAIAGVSYLGVFIDELAASPAAGAAVSVAAIWCFTLVNVAGVRTAGGVQLVTTVLKITPLLAVAAFGAARLDGANFTPWNSSGEPAWSALSAAGALTLWAFLGLESATVPADDVIRPRRTIPLATIAGTLVAAALYLAASTAVIGVVPREALVASPAPFADAAGSLWGSWGRSMVGLGAVVSCFGALNGWTLLAGQVPRALAADGLFPASFARLGRRGTPVFSLVVAATFMTLMVVARFTTNLVTMFTTLTLLATLMSLFPYAMSAGAELMLLARDSQRGMRAAVPAVAALAAFAFAVWAIAGSGREIVYQGFLLLLCGIPCYAWITWMAKRRARVGAGPGPT